MQFQNMSNYLLTLSEGKKGDHPKFMIPQGGIQTRVHKWIRLVAGVNAF